MTGPIILVPLDGTKRALRAMPIAKALSVLRKAPVRLVHVTEAAGPLDETARRLGLEHAHLLGATLETRAGAPDEAILAAAADGRAALIVMCPCTAEGGRAGAIGATAQKVLRGAACPVVLVSPGEPARGDWMLQRVLAPHDGSPSVSAALGPAAELARAAGAEFVVLQAADAEHATERGSIMLPRYVDQPQHTWPGWTGEFVQRLTAHCPLADVRVRVLVGRGERAAETIRVAEEERADLIALAWNGEPTASPMLQAMLERAPCPIMVTRVGGS